MFGEKLLVFWGPNSRPREAADFSCPPLMQNTEVRELIQAKMQIRASENSTKGVLTRASDLNRMGVINKRQRFGTHTQPLVYLSAQDETEPHKNASVEIQKRGNC